MVDWASSSALRPEMDPLKDTHADQTGPEPVSTTTVARCGPPPATGPPPTARQPPVAAAGAAGAAEAAEGTRRPATSAARARAAAPKDRRDRAGHARPFS